MDLCDPFDIEPGGTVHWQTGPLSLWIRRTEVELCIYSEETAQDPPEPVFSENRPAPEDVKWHRWETGEDVLSFQLKPVLPDRPVVVRPENDISFCPDTEEIFYARIPCWLRIMAVKAGGEETLCEIPTKTLSNTWFGPDTTRGELCYGMQTSARRSLAGLPATANRMICPVKMKNVSGEIFNFKRLCIQSNHLSIYKYEKQLWTSRLEIDIRGGNKPEQIRFDEKWFPEAGRAAMISEKRSPQEGNLFRRSFANIKSLTNMI